MSCKCHGRLTTVIKSLFHVTDKKITDGVKECKFLTKSSGNITINKGHKCYTQIVSQMAITETHQAVFRLRTPHDLLVEYIPFDKDHWENVKTS